MKLIWKILMNSKMKKKINKKKMAAVNNAAKLSLPSFAVSSKDVISLLDNLISFIDIKSSNS